ncbi:hypothetical protein CLU91_4891 [Janthinobacterium sp. 64]|nr:hypothetical protein CLU91_4891 [Janthinobacterium sp. 64]
MAFCLDAKPGNAAVELRAVRSLQQENDKLRKDLDRKDKALAEAAALLLLQKSAMRCGRTRSNDLTRSAD